MGKFTPFIEAPRIRTVEQPTTGGMDTSSNDHVRQGVSIRNDKQRFAGVIPKIGTGRNDHVTEVITYGQSSEFNDDPQFELIDIFDPVKYIDNNDSLIFPVILSNATALDPERQGGYIEPFPLAVRDLVSIEGSQKSRGVRGNLGAGNEDSFRKNDQVVQFSCDFPEPEPRDVYIDSSDCIGSSGGDIIIPGFFPEDEKILEPFNESNVLGKLYVSGSVAASLDMQSAILAMTGSSTDSYVPLGCRSAATGFTYGNDTAGVDSIAFGGLKK